VSGTQRIVLVVVAAVIAVAAFVVLRPEDEDEPETTQTTTQTETAPQPAQPDQSAPERTPEARPREPEVQVVRVSGGRPVGGVQTIEVEKGETARFLVRTETPQEVHLHGYDLTESSTASKPAEFRFKADRTGIYELEIHGTHTQIAELRVE
jgi:FtsP/CotA-like multicopper oxidase with cupredoxin domain